MTIPDLRSRKRHDSRAATVGIAFELFAQRGYAAVTVADICAATGIGRRTFFRYFASKDDVLTEPAREMATRVAGALASASTTADDGAVLRSALTAAAQYAVAHQGELRELVRGRRDTVSVPWSPFMRLSEQEAKLAAQLAGRHRHATSPDWRTRLLVARAVAAFRVWLDDLIDESVPADHGHLVEIFDLDPLLS